MQRSNSTSSLVMQMWVANREGNSNPFPYKVGSYAKSALRFQPRSIVQALQTVSRVEMNAQTKGALDTVCNAIRSCRLFKLDTAVVVIHRMTRRRIQPYTVS